jgi:aldehyde:ferredoxin oxidoreductase
MMNGFGGTTLRIDLATGEVRRSPTPESFARSWLGARGFVARTLYDEVPRDADPLGPENLLIVAPGVLTGSFAPCGSKLGFGCISPATNGHADSNMGGHLGPEIKYAGYDMIVFEHAAPEPVYLLIDDDTVELRPAGSYWGKGSLELEKIMKEDLGEDFQIATIGPAGENGVVFACITHDFGRQAGRCGVGAVMGSKKLKAIAVRGTGSLPAHDLPALTKLSYDIIQRTKLHPNMEPWQKYGTALFVSWANEHGCFPSRNFQTTYHEGWEGISGEKLAQEILVTHKACFGCWMNCGKYSRARIPGKPDTYLEGPEYETIALCGGSCGMTDINDVAYANYLCDNLGLDTMSGGNTTGFAMECYQRGIITKEDLEGHELRWGDIHDFEHFIHMVAERRGIGEIFSRGTRGAALALGRDTLRFAEQAKGMEFSGYDTRWYSAQLLSYCTSDIGAHHNRSWAITADIELGQDTTEGKAPVVIYLQHIRPLFDTWACCRLFWGELDVTPEEHAEAISYLTGWDIDIGECMRASERIWNLTRAHYLERNGGPGRRHDVAPLRQIEEEVPSGPAEGHKVGRENFEKMLDDYYRNRGWDRNGNPTREVLEILDLPEVADNLERLGLLGEPFPEGVPEVRGQKLKPKAM